MHSKLVAELNNAYSGCCNHQQGIKLEASTETFATELTNMVEGIWRRKGMPKSGIDKRMVQAFAKTLWGGVTEGYGNDLTSPGIDYDTPDYNMLSRLQNDVYHFSAAKNRKQLKAISKALLSDDGKLRNYSQFKQAAYEINDTHVNQWLKTEYELAVASGQMASKWVDIQASKETLGMIEFDAIMDNRTSEICSTLNGVVKPVDDPFWDVWFPPNHFGCRSTPRQRGGGYKATPDDKISTPEIPKMFHSNLAKNGLIFPKGHAYYVDEPEAVLSFGNANYVKTEFRSGAGEVYESGMAMNPNKKLDKRHVVEYQKKTKVADALANHFNTDVFINPEFPVPSKDWRYPYFYGDAPIRGKQPDFKMFGENWEMESYEKKFKYGRISHMLHAGAQQSGHVIIKLNHHVDIEDIKRRVKGSYNASTNLSQNLKSVLIADKENVVHEVLL